MDYLDKYQKKPKRRKKAKIKKKRILALFVFIILVFFLGVGVRYMSTGRTLETQGDWVETLAYHDDYDYRNTLVTVVNSNNILEYIMIVGQRPADDDLSYMFIPGETYLDTPGNENDVETLMESYSGGESSPNKLIETVEEYFKIKVHDFIKVETVLFAGLPEELGFSVDVDAKALKMDILSAETEQAQIERFKDFHGSITDFYLETKDKMGFFNQPRIRAIIKHHLETNLSWDGLKEHLDTITGEDLTGKANYLTLPSEEEQVNDRVYLLPKMEEMSLLVDQYFSGEVQYVEEEDITVEVLNGCGLEGAATKVAGLLEEKGFQIVRTGNADNFDYQSSQVIARSEPLEARNQVALEVKYADLLVDLDSSSEAMVTVIVGENFFDDEELDDMDEHDNTD